MKWILLAVAMLGMVPLAGWLRQNPREAPKLWLTVGFLAVQHGPLHVYMALDSWAGQWPGYTYGAEVSLLDLIMVAIYTTLPRTQHSTPFLVPMGLYLFASVLSVFQAAIPNAAVFYCSQLVRVIFFYAVVAKACAIDDRVTGALLKGMAFGILLAAGQSIWERFGVGVLQTAGGFPHRNFLGLVSHFVIYPFFALLLVGERGWLPAAVSIGGALIAILTTSRATIAFAGFGYIILFMISAMRGWTAQKSKVLLACIAAVIALSPLFFSSFAERFGSDVADTSFFQADEVRLQMEDAAHMMLADHPMGIGANHYVFAANSLGYSQRSGLSWASFGAYVHNAYLLVAVETGYVGLAALVIMLMRPLVVAFVCGWRARRDKRGDILLGLGVGLLTVYLHNLYEWIFLSFQTEYLFAANAGIIAGLAHQLGYWRRTQVAGSRPAPVAQTVRRESHLSSGGSYPADMKRH